jgi:hypothetical protein
MMTPTSGALDLEFPEPPPEARPFLVAANGLSARLKTRAYNNPGAAGKI